jgi:hypothetical protein
MATSKGRLNPGRRRWLIRLAILLVAALGGLLWAIRGQSQNVLVIENQSGQSIIELTVKVGEQEKTYRDVPNKDEVVTPFHLTGSEPFSVTGKLRDNTLIRGQFGARAATGDRPTLLVQPGGQILLKPASKNGS